jgi:hypothetical protein
VELIVVALPLLRKIAAFVYIHITTEILTVVTIAESSVGCTQLIRLRILPQRSIFSLCYMRMLTFSLLNMLQEHDKEFIIVTRSIGALICDTPQDVTITAERFNIDVVIEKGVI